MLGEESPEVLLERPEDIDLLEKLSVLPKVRLYPHVPAIAGATPEQLRKLVAYLERDFLPAVVRHGDREVAKELLDCDLHRAVFAARSDVSLEEAKELIDQIKKLDTLREVIRCGNDEKLEYAFKRAQQLDLNDDEKSDIASLVMICGSSEFIKKHLEELCEWNARMAVAAFKGRMSKEVLEMVLDRASFEDKLAILRAPSATAKALEVLAQDSDSYIRSRALKKLRRRNVYRNSKAKSSP